MTEEKEKVVVSKKQKIVKSIVGILVLCGILGIGVLVKHKLKDLAGANNKCRVQKEGVVSEKNTGTSEIDKLLEKHKTLLKNRKNQIVGTYKSDLAIFEFKDDFTFTVVVKVDNDKSVSQEGTWMFNDNKIKLSNGNGPSLIYTLYENKIDIGNGNFVTKIK